MKAISPEDLESLLGETQAALREVGNAAGVWARLPPCTCGEPDCEIEDPGRHSITLQLDVLGGAWSAGAAAPEDGAQLATTLGRLCDLLGLPGDAPAPGADPVTLLHALRDRWLAGMGTPLGGPPGEAWLTTLYRVEARNGLLLDKLLVRVAGTTFAKLAAAGASHARLKRLRTSREGITAVGRALRIWIDDSDSLPERSLLREHLLAIVAEAPWTPGEAQDVVQMGEDAARAVLAFGIAADPWVAAAYGAMEQIAPFSALRVALLLTEDPVPATTD